MFINTTKTELTLDYPIDNREGKLTIAIREMFYRVKWFNISGTKKNNWVKKFDNGRLASELTLRDGYYGFCELKKVLKDKHEIDLDLSDANLSVTLTFKQVQSTYRFAKKLANILGFENNTFNVNTNKFTFEGDNPLDLEVNSPLLVHLEELSTTENLWNGRPSNLLRVIPSSDNASYCKHEVKSFPNPQFKKLINRPIDKLRILIKDRNGDKIECDGLFMVLEIKYN